MSATSIVLQNMDPHDRLRQEVIAGLSLPRKWLSSIWLYDEKGSQIFEKITELDEYYVTRTEAQIFETSLTEIARLIGPGATIVEYGAGSLLKIRKLLDELDRPKSYIPIDISTDFLKAAAAELRLDYPRIAITPMSGDILGAQLPSLSDAKNTESGVIGLFLGSTIGNFVDEEIARFFSNVRKQLGNDAHLLIGYDMRKSEEILIPAYDDSAGVTAAFNLNILAHLNCRLGSDFNLDGFKHHAVWRENPGRIEMHLESLVDQHVRIGEQMISFAAGEVVITEISRKFSLGKLESLAEMHGGWQPQKTWRDPKDWFSLSLMR